MCRYRALASERELSDEDATDVKIELQMKAAKSMFISIVAASLTIKLYISNQGQASGGMGM